MKKVFTLIAIMSLIVIMIGNGAGAKVTTMANSSIEKDRLEIIKEKGTLTVAGPPKEIPFFYRSRNK